VKAGEVFIYPTDTVYGIGCDALNEEAVKRVFDAKGRDFNKPLSVAFKDVPQLLRFVDVDEGQRREIEGKLPGPYTFIVKNKHLPKTVTAGLETVGVRVPRHDLIRELIRESGVPIVTTSANLAGGPAPSHIYEVPNEVIEKADFAIDAGKCGSGKPSTIIDLSTGKCLR
jgi:L-threonylcarbamoyladenylate synthase